MNEAEERFGRPLALARSASADLTSEIEAAGASEELESLANGVLDALDDLETAMTEELDAFRSEASDR